jgi:Skp family chaperone for outer membrane proteins
MQLKTIALLLPLGLVPSLFATQEGATKSAKRIAVVNMQRVLTESKLAQDALKAHEEWVKTSQREIDAGKKGLKKIDEDMQLLDSHSLEFQQNKDQLELENTKFQQLVRRLQKEREDRFIQIMQKNYDLTVQQVNGYAKAHGLELVLQLDTTQLRANSQDELLSRILWKNVVYADEALDITSDLLKILGGQ